MLQKLKLYCFFSSQKTQTKSLIVVLFLLKPTIELQRLGLNFPSVSRAGISLGWRRRVLQPGPSTGRFGTRAGFTVLICVGPYSRASNPRPMDQAEC